MLNQQESRESRNTRLTHEISECKDKIIERERERERERESKNLTTFWEVFSGGIVFSILMAFLAVYQDGRWWIVFVIMTLGVALGLWGIISKNAKLKKINKEVERLKKQEKDLKSQLRF